MKDLDGRSLHRGFVDSVLYGSLIFLYFFVAIVEQVTPVYVKMGMMV